MSASITLSRGTGYADRLRSYRVMLDGKEIGRIGNGETKSFPVGPGQHELVVKIDWCSSTTLASPFPRIGRWHSYAIPRFAG